MLARPHGPVDFVRACARSLALFTVLGLALTAMSCAGSGDEDASTAPGAPRLGKSAQALTDTDGDGMDDDWETQYFGGLSQTASGDYDADGMTNLEEYSYGFDPTVADAFDDADGDRYPNVFEIKSSADPNDAGSVPTPAYVVDGSGGGTHTTVSAAITAANGGSNTYPIVGIAAGVYTGSGNVGVSISSSKKLLIIGLEGAATTIFDNGANGGWNISSTAIVASLTFQRMPWALEAYVPSGEVRFIDVRVKDGSVATSYATGVHVAAAARAYVVGSTFLNVAHASLGQIYIGSGSLTVVNTVVSGSGSGTMLVHATGTTLTTTNCLVKGQTLSGNGNLAGTTDPKLRSDGRLLWDSPLRAAGGSVAQSRIDMDGESRPATTPDIGVDQFVDSDGDELADSWELETAGNLTTLTSRTQDFDSDGLTNDEEYANGTLANVADSDGDGVSDGDEVTLYGTNPLSTDTDADGMPDDWEIAHGLAPATANAFDDDDGDRFPNVFEYAHGTDPSDLASTPTPAFVVDATGGGTHTTLSAAINAANGQSNDYPIIGIAAGVYTGSGNVGLSFSSTKKPLIVGLGGASKTIFDNGPNGGWSISGTAIISSLTFQRMSWALQAYAPTGEVRFVDVRVKDGLAPTYYATGVHIASAAKAYVIGSTFLNVRHGTFGEVYVGSGQLTVLNTVVWGSGSGAVLVNGAGTTLTATNCLAKGQTLSGSGNLAGTTDPKLTPAGRIPSDSPLRAAGASVPHSRLDMDGELRPASAPDIGVDEFIDTDPDGLADSWELETAGDLTSLTSATQDFDGDGLTNGEEYANDTAPNIADSDGDGLSDGDEVTLYGTSPLKADTDDDGMPDAWEVTHGLTGTTSDAYDDADGDRFPNIFEYAYATDPSDRSSTPTPTIVVDASGGGTQTTVSDAVTAANAESGDYRIIGIAPGVYTGPGNVDITISSSKKLLIVGLEGASNTIFDNGGDGYGWQITSTAIVSSLTFQRMSWALYAYVPSGEVRFIDLRVKDGMTPGVYATGVHIASAAKAYVVGSTFLNVAHASDGQLYIGSGQLTVLNTVVWATGSGPMLVNAGGTTLTTNNCLVKGRTLTGTGNLAGTTDPKLRSDGRLLSDSPLRAAGGSVAHSRLDMDGELRASSAPDIGVDQFVDADSDQLADNWELEYAGDLTTLTAPTQDFDSDGLINDDEYGSLSNPVSADTDGDGIKDGVEIAQGLNPIVKDSDDLGSDLNDDGVIESIGTQLGYSYEATDTDGDSVSNADEALACIDVLRQDSDGDGIADDIDPFPLDPSVSALPSDPQDVTPPIITLTAPWYAVEQ